MLISQMKKIFLPLLKNDYFFQSFLVFSLFFGLTGGAFLIKWEWLKPFRDLQRFLSYALILFSIAFTWWRYCKDKTSFFRLEPVRTIKAFFDWPALYSVSFLFFLYAATQIIYQIVFHAAMETALWDFAFYDQIIWNTAHGHFLVTSVRGGLHIFCEHFKPIIALLAPIYHITNNTNVLLSVFTSINASVIVSAYLIARLLTRSHYTGLIIAISVFFYQPFINAFNFLLHTQVLADPLILFAFYCMLRKRIWFGILFFILALGCKQNIAIDVFGVGLFLMLKRNKGGWVVAALALIALIAYTFYIEPTFRYPYHFVKKSDCYSHLITWKLDEWQRLLKPNPIMFFILVFGPFAFLSFRCKGWYWLLGPSLLFRLLIAWPNFRTITYHYTGGLNALVIISAAYGVASFFEIQQKAEKDNCEYKFVPQRWLKNEQALLSVLFLSVFLFAGTPHLFKIDKYLTEASERGIQKIAAILDSVPSDYSVLASERLSAHLSHRPYLFVFQSMFPKAPYENLAANPDLIFVDGERINHSENQDLNKMLTAGYQHVFNFSFLDIYSGKDVTTNPTFLQTLSRWQAIASSPEVNYRNEVRIIYILVIVLAGLSWLIAQRI
jgi:uncharacterized membrane protein